MRWIVCIFFVLLVPCVSSISTTMLPEYQQGETMIAEIQGNILEPIERSDIIFKRAHVAIAVDYDVKRIGSSYYIYAQMPTMPNNYTLFINNIATTVNGVVTSVNYNQTFTVSNNLSDYSIDPGFIIANSDFSLVIDSNLDQSTTINTDFPQEGTVTLQPGQNVISFNINSINPGIYTANIGKYHIPIQILSSSPPNQSREFSLRFFPPALRESLLSNKEKNYTLTITNTGDNADNLYFSFNQNIFTISPSEISSIESNRSVNVTLSLKKLNGSIDEVIFLARENEILSNFTLHLTFTENESQVTTNSSFNRYYCSELGGKFCSANEICSGQLTSSLDGSCCVGSCTIEKSTSSSWIFYSFFALVVGIVLVIYFRYKKTKLPKPKEVSIDSVLKRPI